MDFQISEIMLQISTLLYISGMAGYLLFLFGQKERVQKTAFYITGTGILFHLASMVIYSITSKTLPVHNLEQSLSLAGVALGCMFVYFRLKFNLKILGVFVSVLLSFIMVSVLLIPKAPVEHSSILKGFWFHSHIILVFTGEAALAMACGTGILYLLQEKNIKTKKPGFFFKRLPSLDLLDNISYTCITTGFALLTFGLVTGFIYAKTIWGRFWSWDPKEIWSIVTWLIYAGILHFRFHSGWRGRKSALMTIAGFLIIIFTFLGVNILIGGHHQDFTK